MMSLFPRLRHAQAVARAWEAVAIRATVEATLAADTLALQRARMKNQAAEHLGLLRRIADVEAENGSLHQALDALLGNAPADVVPAVMAETIELPCIRDEVPS
jgi:hypothetical protein